MFPKKVKSCDFHPNPLVQYCTCVHYATGRMFRRKDEQSCAEMPNCIYQFVDFYFKM